MRESAAIKQTDSRMTQRKENTTTRNGLSKVDSLKSLNRAFSSFLNPVGPGEYTLPGTFASKSVVSNKRSVPSYTIKLKHEIPNMPEYAKHY
jgi:hypothetical protein